MLVEQYDSTGAAIYRAHASSSEIERFALNSTGAITTLELNVHGPRDAHARITVEITEAPGPSESAFADSKSEEHLTEFDPPVQYPMITAAELYSEARLLAFLAEVSAGGTHDARVRCLRPRVAQIFNLLKGHPPGPIEVPPFTNG
jgi:hypothetical protein